MYSFFRTEQTLINVISIKLLGLDTFHDLKYWVLLHVSLNPFEIYSLPGALWIFSITLISKRYILMLGNWEFPLWLMPLFLSIGFELFQYLHWLNGSYDLADLISGIAFWLLGLFLFPERNPKLPLFKSFNVHKFVCVASYAVVYLAHVMY